MIRPLPFSKAITNLDISLTNKGVFNFPSPWTTVRFPYQTTESDPAIIEGEYMWMHIMKKVLDKDILEPHEWLTWAAYHATYRWYYRSS